MQAKSNWLVVVISGLAAALLCFALVESVNRSTLKYGLISLGVIIMLAGVAATVAIEYFLFV